MRIIRLLVLRVVDMSIQRLTRLRARLDDRPAAIPNIGAITIYLDGRALADIVVPDIVQEKRAADGGRVANDMVRVSIDA